MEKVRSKYTYPDFQYVRFRLGVTDLGIDVKGVKEIIRYRGLTRAERPGFADGSVQLRGISVPVLDLRRRFRLNADVTDSTSIIIAAITGHVMGLVVDAVTDVAMGIKEIKIRLAEGNTDPLEICSEAAVETGSGTVSIIDAARILTKAELAELDSPAGGF